MIKVILPTNHIVVQSHRGCQEESREDFLEELSEDYNDIREEHNVRVADLKFLSLEEARARAPLVDWGAGFRPTRPKFLGTKVYRSFPLEELVPYIDWKPFFDVWQLRGKYPNSR